MLMKIPSSRALAAMLLGAVAVGCDGMDDGVTGVGTTPSLAVADRVDESVDILPGVVQVCAFGLGDGPDGTAEFAASATGGDYLTDFTIPWQPHCIETWNATSSDPVTFTATILSAYNDSEYFAVERAFTFVGDGTGDPVQTEFPGAESASVDVSDETGGFIWFKLEVTDPPNGGDGAGCTPGFWRQPHHYEYWTGSTPDDAWTTIFADPGSHSSSGQFGATFDGSTVLGDAVQLNGGGIFALARHAVAAVLNARSADVDYDMTEAEVVALVNDALSSGEYESAKDLLQGFNELGCTVDKSN